MLSPGPERVAALGGLHRFMGWGRAIITDSGGFQVFSLAHGRVADEIKGRRGRRPARGACSRSASRGCASAPTSTARSSSSGPRSRWRCRRALGSDIALAFDECTPYHADRDYTARSMERTHRWLDRCLAWHERQGPAPPGGVRDRSGRRPRGPAPRGSRARVSAAPVDGLAIGGTLGRDKEEMRGVVGMTAPHLAAEAPRHLLGIGEPDDLVEGIALGVDLFDCAVPTRLARHGMALAPLPGSRFRFDVRRAEFVDRRGPAGRGLSVRDLRRAQPRLRPLPLASRGADRRSAARAPQPHLPGAPGPRAPGEAIRAARFERLPAGDPRRRAAVARGGAPPSAP